VLGYLCRVCITFTSRDLEGIYIYYFRPRPWFICREIRRFMNNISVILIVSLCLTIYPHIIVLWYLYLDQYLAGLQCDQICAFDQAKILQCSSLINIYVFLFCSLFWCMTSSTPTIALDQDWTYSQTLHWSFQDPSKYGAMKVANETKFPHGSNRLGLVSFVLQYLYSSYRQGGQINCGILLLNGTSV